VGANPVAIKLGLADVAPLRMAFFRFAVSAMVIFRVRGDDETR